MARYKSFFRILSTDMCLETTEKKINDFCEFMWHEFLNNTPSADVTIIKVLPTPHKKRHYSFYHNDKIAIDYGRELVEEPYSILPKVLENIVLGHTIIQADKKELIPLHSGAVSIAHKGIFILGEGGNGKSTLTLELVANHCWFYLTDEVGLLDIKLNIHPFPKTVSYTPGIIDLNNGWITKRFGCEHQVAVPKKKHGAPVPLEAIFYIKYSPDTKPIIKPIKKSDSLIRLLNSQIGMPRSFTTVEQIAEMVKKVNSYQIYHNDASETARLITKLIETGV